VAAGCWACVGCESQKRLVVKTDIDRPESSRTDVYWVETDLHVSQQVLYEIKRALSCADGLEAVCAVDFSLWGQRHAI
jgi:hypothetical protein